MKHKMHLIDSDEGIWHCPICDRKIMIKYNEYRTLTDDDMSVQHYGNFEGGVSLSIDANYESDVEYAINSLDLDIDD